MGSKPSRRATLTYGPSGIRRVDLLVSPHGPKAARKPFSRPLLQIVAAASFLSAAIPVAARGEATVLNIARCSPMGCLPMMVVEQEGLIEKHAKRLGLNDLKVRWKVLNEGIYMNTGIVAGEIDVAATGAGAFVTLWDKSKGRLDVKGILALSGSNLSLVTRNPAVTSIKDLGENDRISLPSALVSIHATTLQRAAMQAFGIAECKRLDHLTVSMAPAEGFIAMTNGSEVTSYLSNPPFTERVLKKPGIHRVFNSDEIWGGRLTTFLVYAPSRVRTDNPKAYQALLAALNEAFQLIAHDKKKAAEIYLKASGEKATPEEIVDELENPEQVISPVPQRMLEFAQFKQQIGAIKDAPVSWQDMFFPEANDLPGN